MKKRKLKLDILNLQTTKKLSFFEKLIIQTITQKILDPKSELF
jgi:hypothetical protein